MSVPDRVSAVLFDAGNTLHHIDYAFIADAVSARGLAVSPEDVAVADYAAKAAVDANFRARRGGTDDSRRFSYFGVMLSALAVPEEVQPSILEAIRNEDTRACLWRVTLPETTSVLAALSARGFALAVVSNSDGRVASNLRAAGLADHFDTIVDSFVVGVEKPDPRIFRPALDACGVEPAEAVFVGDIYEIDVTGARAAGITPILIDPLDRYGEVDCLLIDRLQRLLDLLPERAAR